MVIRIAKRRIYILELDDLKRNDGDVYKRQLQNTLNNLIDRLHECGDILNIHEGNFVVRF